MLLSEWFPYRVNRVDPLGDMLITRGPIVRLFIYCVKLSALICKMAIIGANFIRYQETEREEKNISL